MNALLGIVELIVKSFLGTLEPIPVLVHAREELTPLSLKVLIINAHALLHTLEMYANLSIVMLIHVFMASVPMKQMVIVVPARLTIVE